MAHDSSHDQHHAGTPAEGHHAFPSPATYIKVGIVLTIITAVEVWVYYIPSFVASKAFVPSLLLMSLVKFVTVVAVYMHLKYDHKLFRALFIGPLIIAAVTMIGLLFLFGQFSIRIGALN